VSANQHERVAGAGIRQRNARVGRRADGDGHARHHLERDPLFVQEDRFLGAAREHERVAPLEPRDGVTLARLFGEQDGDGFLRGVPLGGRADGDPLRVGPRQAQQRLDGAVVHDHVSRGEQTNAAGGDQSRIARARPDQIHTAHT
jgi:hypothetical protein